MPGYLPDKYVNLTPDIKLQWLWLLGRKRLDFCIHSAQQWT